MEEKKSNTNLIKAVLKSLGLAFFSVLVPTIASIIIQVKELTSESRIYLVQGCAYALGSLAIIWLIKRSSFSFKAVGFQGFSLEKWMLILVVTESTALINGFSALPSLAVLIILGLFMIAVGIFEELVFRGLMLQLLKKINPQGAILGSAVLFGLGHLANLLNGAELKLTILQIIFAFLFGIVCGEMVLKTGSILLPISWHLVHNILATLTDKPESLLNIYVVLGQCLILASLSVYLWHQLFVKKKHR